jgi:xanthine/uracil permease
MSLMPAWRVTDAQPGRVVAPDERLPWGLTIALGAQHVIAMFGATVLAPLLATSAALRAPRGSELRRRAPPESTKS